MGHFFICPVLLLGPVIAERSVRGLVAIPLGIGITFCLLLACSLTINGRESLPLTVLITPGVLWAVPWYDDISLGWEARAYWGFVSYWLVIDVLVLGSRRFIKRLHVLPSNGQIGAAALAIAVSFVPAIVLYRLSWAYRLSGTRMYPLPNQSQLTYYGSLLLFWLVFPVKMYSLNYVYGIIPDRTAHSLRKTGPPSE